MARNGWWRIGGGEMVSGEMSGFSKKEHRSVTKT